MMCAAVNYAADKSRIRCASQCREHGKARRQLLRASSDAPAMQRAESHPFADRPKPEQHTKSLTVARSIKAELPNIWAGWSCCVTELAFWPERSTRDDALSGCGDIERAFGSHTPPRKILRLREHQTARCCVTVAKPAGNDHTRSILADATEQHTGSASSSAALAGPVW